VSRRKIILVSGLVGSGTSRISESLHRSGVEMVVTMMPPPPGMKTYLDWEDFVYVAWCGLSTFTTGEPGRVRDYLEYRFKRSPIWGVKSPFLLPHIDFWRRWAKSWHAELWLLLSQRAFDDCQASIRKWLDPAPQARDSLLTWNEKAREFWQRESGEARLVPFGWEQLPIFIGDT